MTHIHTKVKSVSEVSQVKMTCSHDLIASLQRGMYIIVDLVVNIVALQQEGPGFNSWPFYI